MRDITTELKVLRLHGMVSAWADLIDQGTTSTSSSKWLIEHLLQVEHTERVMRSERHQMTVVKFPVHKYLAGFDFVSSMNPLLEDEKPGKPHTSDISRIDTASPLRRVVLRSFIIWNASGKA